MEPIKFTKFDGGKIVSSIGELVEVNEKFVIVGYEGNNYSFRRAPGSKSGYGIGTAKNWRLGLDERTKYVHQEILKRR